MKTIYIKLFLFSFVLISCKEQSLEDLTSNFIAVDDVNVHFKVKGSGQNKLVFIHGWGCDLNAWNKQFDYNFVDSQMIFIDLPGFGLSSKPHLEYDQNLFAKAIYGVLQELNIDNPTLIGHSLGYPVSKQVINNYPKLKPKLCIVDGVYFKFPIDSINRISYVKQLEGFKNLFTGGQRDTNIDAFINSLYVETTPQNVKDYAARTMKNVNEHVGYSTMSNLIKEEVWIDTKKDIPTLIVYADIPELPVDNENYFRKLYPNLEYHEVSESGHFVMMEQPEVFNKLLNSFLEKL